MQVRLGTSGYSYKEWKGSFYPEDLPATKMLGYYAERLNAVEINNTFYRMPKREVIRRWAEQVPDDFSFTLKASMRITHKKRLKECEDEIEFLCGNARELGDKLGPMLFQLPPWFRKDTDRLRGFLEALPEGWKSAFEFRHASWFDDETYAVLKEGGAALVVSETDAEEPPPVVPTAAFGYLRLRLPEYTEQQLGAWAERVKAQPWEEVRVFFKHEKDGSGPELAARFRKLV